MTCSDPDCNEQGCPETSNWNVGVLCHEHYEEVKGKYSGFPQAPDDFVKVHVLLQYNEEKCKECIKKLADQMTKAKAMPMADDPRFSEGLGQNYLKLSRALEYYEGYCWFPANRILLTGLLGRVDFYKNLKYGFNKDPGAGVYHGDQSHRVQWHVIMRCMTNDFQTPIYKNAGWNHSPLGLFYKYTQADSKPDNPNTGAWAISMDRVSNAGWGSPDSVARYLKESGPPSLRRRYCVAWKSSLLTIWIAESSLLRSCGVKRSSRVVRRPNSSRISSTVITSSRRSFHATMSDSRTSMATTFKWP
jgi:hypothetical protein